MVQIIRKGQTEQTTGEYIKILKWEEKGEEEFQSGKSTSQSRKASSIHGCSKSQICLETTKSPSIACKRLSCFFQIDKRRPRSWVLLFRKSQFRIPCNLPRDLLKTKQAHTKRNKQRHDVVDLSFLGTHPPKQRCELRGSWAKSFLHLFFLRHVFFNPQIINSLT